MHLGQWMGTKWQPHETQGKHWSNWTLKRHTELFTGDIYEAHQNIYVGNGGANRPMQDMEGPHRNVSTRH